MEIFILRYDASIPLDCGGPAASIYYHLLLTGPEGQPFASRLGGQRFASRGCTHTYMNRVHLSAMSSYIDDPEVIPDHQLW
jgi:hypothetical protein